MRFEFYAAISWQRVQRYDFYFVSTNFCLLLFAFLAFLFIISPLSDAIGCLYQLFVILYALLCHGYQYQANQWQAGSKLEVHLALYLWYRDDAQKHQGIVYIPQGVEEQSHRADGNLQLAILEEKYRYQRQYGRYALQEEERDAGGRYGDASIAHHAQVVYQGGCSHSLWLDAAYGQKQAEGAGYDG